MPGRKQPPKARAPLNKAGLFDYAVGALARRMRTERDLRRLLASRAQPGGEGLRSIDAVIARLKELNYLSDERFASDYTRLRKENQKLGKRRIQQDLAAKGIAADLIGHAVGAAYQEVDELALIREYIARKRMKQPAGENMQKEITRAAGRLLRAGFSTATVFKVLREWGLESDEADLAASDPLENAHRDEDDGPDELKGSDDRQAGDAER